MAESPTGPPDQPRWVAVLQRGAIMFAPFIVLIVGLALSVGSLATQLQTNYATSYAGTLAPGNATLVLPPQDTQYLQISLNEGGCDLRVYPATDAQWLLFNDTGALPPTWIGCVNRNTTTTGDVSDLILVEGGSTAGPYNVTVVAYSIETPYGWIALPGTALALAGLLVLVPRIAMERATRMRDEFSGKKEK